MGCRRREFRSAVVACERTLLWTWDAIRATNLTRTKAVRLAHARTISLYLETSVMYLRKVQAHLHTQDALARYSGESALIAELVFEEVGFIATIGLAHLLWGASHENDHQLESADAMANTLVAFLNTHRASGSPCYEDQSIDIGLALIFLLFAGRTDATKRWLSDLSGRIAFGFQHGSNFPISTDSFDDLVQLHTDRKNVDMTRLTQTSCTVPMLAQWAAALEADDAYENLVQLQQSVLKETTFQLWYPDGDTDKHIWSGPAHGAGGMTEAPMHLPATGAEMRSMIVTTRAEFGNREGGHIVRAPGGYRLA